VKAGRKSRRFPEEEDAPFLFPLTTRPEQSGFSYDAGSPTPKGADDQSQGANPDFPVSGMIRRSNLSRRLPMSMEVTNIGQQLTAMDRRLEGSVNSSLRSTAEALQTAENAAKESLKGTVSEDKVSRIVEQIQTVSNLFDRKLSFQVNKELDEVIVKVIDSNTDKVIREIPSAEIQKLQIRIKEALGLLFDESI